MLNSDVCKIRRRGSLRSATIGRQKQPRQKMLAIDVAWEDTLTTSSEYIASYSVYALFVPCIGIDGMLGHASPYNLNADSFWRL